MRAKKCGDDLDSLDVGVGVGVVIVVGVVINVGVGCKKLVAASLSKEQQQLTSADPRNIALSRLGSRNADVNWLMPLSVVMA